MPIVRVALGKEFFQMFRWLNQSATGPTSKASELATPELGLRTLEDWLI